MCVCERESERVIKEIEREKERKLESERRNKNEIKKSDNNKKYFERKMGKFVFLSFSFRYILSTT